MLLLPVVPLPLEHNLALALVPGPFVCSRLDCASAELAFHGHNKEALHQI